MKHYVIVVQIRALSDSLFTTLINNLISVLILIDSKIYVKTRQGYRTTDHLFTLTTLIIISLFAITPLQVLAIQRKKEKEKEKKNSQGTHYKVQGHKTTYSVN